MPGKPTRLQLFDGLYATLEAGGRARALFGDSRQGARSSFGRCLIGDVFPAVYLEFPLAGEPALDLLAIYDRVPAGSRFASGSGYGYQGVFDWFSGVDGSCDAAVGIELDLSRGVTGQAGVYLQQRHATQLVRPFLQAVGRPSRADAYLRMAERMPRGWPAAYVGLFPMREHTPLRLGGYLSEPSRRRCAEDPAFLGSRFDLMGFGAYDDEMLARCARLMGLVPAVDFQFDLDPNGRLMDTFGLSLSFGRVRPGEAASCFEGGYGAQVMEAFGAWGLVDGRWRLIPATTCARRIDYERPEGGMGSLVASVRLNYAKVKFVGSVAQTAKFYLVMMVSEADRR